MPYIRRELREQLDPAIETVKSAIGRLPAGDADGIMNYAITKILTGIYGRRYSAYMAMVGTLEAVKLELYRKLAAPYEDRKAIENGEVYDET